MGTGVWRHPSWQPGTHDTCLGQPRVEAAGHWGGEKHQDCISLTGHGVGLLFLGRWWLLAGSPIQENRHGKISRAGMAGLLNSSRPQTGSLESSVWNPGKRGLCGLAVEQKIKVWLGQPVVTPWGGNQKDEYLDLRGPLSM